MKTLLICPGEREAVRGLAESMPLSNVPILGKPLIEYWLEYLARRGATQVYVLATDRPEQVRTLIQDGTRWGLKVDVLPEVGELELDEARAKYQSRTEPGWLASPDDAHVMDCLPGQPPGRLFTSYADWFAAVQAWMPLAGLRPTKKSGA